MDSSSTLCFGISLLKMMLDYLACSLFFLLYVLVEFPLCDASILDDEGAERLPPFFLTIPNRKRIRMPCLAYRPQMLSKVLSRRRGRTKLSTYKFFYSEVVRMRRAARLLFNFQPTTEVKDLTGQTD